VWSGIHSINLHFASFTAITLPTVDRNNALSTGLSKAATAPNSFAAFSIVPCEARGHNDFKVWQFKAGELQYLKAVHFRHSEIDNNQVEVTRSGSEQEFDGHRILSGFRQIPIFRPDRRHALSLQQQVTQILVSRRSLPQNISSSLRFG
jgi:hypothetical protein